MLNDPGIAGAMTTNILILCTYNSARSVLAEGMLNHLARKSGKDVRAFSAGSAPSGRIHPRAIAALEKAGAETAGLHSKHWDQFAGPDAPRMRVVITVCDSAAAETCPFWPGAPVRVHWGYADPSSAPEPERAEAFERTRDAIASRMMQLVELPFDELSDAGLERALTELSRS